MSGANSINFNRTPVVLRIRHWCRWIVGDEIHPFHSILFDPLSKMLQMHARALRPINLGTAVRHALRYDGTCDLSPGLRSCCVIALVPLRVSLTLSRHVSTQERFMSFCWQNNKIPERKESLSQPRVCVCGLSLGTWHARELTSGSTNWAIFRSANGLKVLQLSPYILGRSDCPSCDNFGILSTKI